MQTQKSPAGGPGNTSNSYQNFTASSRAGQGPTHHDLHEYGRRALVAECALLINGTGGRNDALNKSAFKIGQLVGGGVLDRAEAEQHLSDAARQIGLETLEIRATLKSGLDRGILSPRIPEPRDNFSGRQQPATRNSPQPRQDEPPSWLDDGPPPESYDGGASLPGNDSPSGGERTSRHDPAAIWAACQSAPDDHPYLTKKRVQAHGLRLYRGSMAIANAPVDGALVVPLRNAGGDIQSLQFITPDGKKLLLPNHQKKGALHAIGNLTEIICIAEGFATAASIHEATGHQTFMSVDSGNLLPVAQTIRAAHPHHVIFLAADDDRHLSSNPGLTKAEAAARAIGGFLAVPDFGPDRQAGQTDFNDLVAHRGLGAVRAAIEGARKVDSFGQTTGKPLPKKPTTFSMRELADSRFEPVLWSVTNLLTQWIYILGGKSKVGKSWLAFHIALSKAYGRPVFGSLQTQKAGVLYISMEDHQRRLKNRMQQICHDEPTDNLHCAIEWPRIGEGCVEQLDEWLTDHPSTKLVILDTLARIKPPRGRNGDIYAEDYAAVSAFKGISEKHAATILLVHHLRKMASDDPADMLSGTTGLAGGVDGTLILVKDHRKPNEPLTLHRSGRDLMIDDPLSLNWDKESGVWTTLDSKEAFRQAITEEQQTILDTLHEAGCPLSIQEIANLTGKNVEATRKVMGRMVIVGVLLKNGPHNQTRYSLSTSHPSQPSHPSHPSQPGEEEE
ncbi:MAG: AAA family ATPase, partial [Magnetococcus sp. YQC-5]